MIDEFPDWPPCDWWVSDFDPLLKVPPARRSVVVDVWRVPRKGNRGEFRAEWEKVWTCWYGFRAKPVGLAMGITVWGVMWVPLDCGAV